jgi:hypothetical protein
MRRGVKIAIAQRGGEMGGLCRLGRFFRRSNSCPVERFSHSERKSANHLPNRRKTNSQRWL